MFSPSNISAEKHAVRYCTYKCQRSTTVGENSSKMKLFDLFQIIYQGKLVLIQWLQARGLVKDTLRCAARGCRAVMQLKPRSDIQDRYHWKCSRARCKKTKTLRVVSFFAKSNLPLGDIVSTIYCWAVGMSMTTTATVLGLSNHTVIDWYNFPREECSAKLIRMPIADKKLGGVGHIVEIDESLMVKRKYNRGGLRQQHQEWVFGMYDRTSGKGWIKFVPRRDADTLLAIIQEFVHPGSTVYSDGWNAYNNIANLGYVHGRVIHEENFVDPSQAYTPKGRIIYH